MTNKKFLCSGIPLFALIAAATLAGCVATQRDVLDIEQQADEVKVQVQDLKKTLSSLQANQADLSVKIDQTHSDLNSFSERLKDFQDSVGRLSSKMDDLQTALGQKVSALGETLTKQQQDLAAQEAARKAAEQAAASGPSPSQIYYSAQMQLSKRNYKLAAQGLQTYLQKFPKGEVADLATYYLGETYYAEKTWEEAARQFALVLDRFPKSDLTPAARLKYALSLIKLKKHLPEAKRYLESIPADYPKSSEAPLAERLLKKQFKEDASDQ